MDVTLAFFFTFLTAPIDYFFTCCDGCTRVFRITSFNTFCDAYVVAWEFISGLGSIPRLPDAPDKDDLPEEGSFAVYKKAWFVGDSCLHLFLLTSGLMIRCLEFDLTKRGWKFKFVTTESYNELVWRVRPRSL